MKKKIGLAKYYSYKRSKFLTNQIKEQRPVPYDESKVTKLPDSPTYGLTDQKKNLRKIKITWQSMVSSRPKVRISWCLVFKPEPAERARPPARRLSALSGSWSFKMKHISKIPNLKDIPVKDKPYPKWTDPCAMCGKEMPYPIKCGPESNPHYVCSVCWYKHPGSNPVSFDHVKHLNHV